MYQIWWKAPHMFRATTTGETYPTANAAWEQVHIGLRAIYGPNPKGEDLRKYKEQLNCYKVLPLGAKG